MTHNNNIYINKPIENSEHIDTFKGYIYTAVSRC